MNLNKFLNAKEARYISNNYVSEDTKRVLEQIGDEIINIARNGGHCLFITEREDIWYPYFDSYAVQFLEGHGYKVSYELNGVDGNDWFISW